MGMLQSTFDIVNILAPTTDVTAATTSAVLDMSNCEGALIVCGYGNNATDAQPSFALITGSSATATGSTVATLTAATTAVDDKLHVFDLHRPTKRYAKVVATPGSTDATEGLYAIAIKYGVRKGPVSLGSTSVHASTLLVGSS